MALRLIHITQQKVKAAQQGLGVEAIKHQLLKTLTCVLNAFRLALGKTCSGQSHRRKEGRIHGAGLLQTAVKVHLLLNGQEPADLLEKQLEGSLIHACRQVRCRQPVQATALQSSTGTDELLQHRQTLAARGLFSQIPTEQIQNPEGEQLREIGLQRKPLIRQLAHALQQLLAVLQQVGRRLIAALLLVLPGGITTGQRRQQ